MKHEPDCSCLTCYQTLRKFRDEARALAEEWRESYTDIEVLGCADQLVAIIKASEKQVS